MTGVADGLVGVVVEPYKGAKQSGFRGFLNGTWSSAKGLVLKPFCGTLDLVSKSSKGLVKTVNAIMGEDGGEEVAEKLRKGNRLMYGRESWIEKWDQATGKVAQELELIDGQKNKDLHLLDSFFLGTSHTIVFTLQHLLVCLLLLTSSRSSIRSPWMWRPPAAHWTFTPLPPDAPHLLAPRRSSGCSFTQRAAPSSGRGCSLDTMHAP